MATLTDQEKQKLEQQLQTLRDLKASGVLSVRHGETSTYFRSVGEIDAAINDILTQLNLADGRRRRRVFYITQWGKAY